MAFERQIIFLSLLSSFFIRFCESRCSEGLYFDKLPFRKFELGNVFQTISVEDEIQCIMSCLSLQECLSMNIANQPKQDGSFECILLRELAMPSSGLLMLSQIYHYYFRRFGEGMCAIPRCKNGGTCITLLNDYRCHCGQKFVGKDCELDHNTSCAGLKIDGKNDNGVYNITPVPGYTVQVYCDQKTDGGGWTVIQKRFDGSVDFYRGWDDYKRGFGNKNGEYWLGLDVIHYLTNLEQNEIRIDLEDFNGRRFFALYDMFRVGPESQKYKLFLGSYEKGDAGDSMDVHNGMKFTTRDQDNDVNTMGNCAKTFKGGWWFWDCHKCHLNGEYHKQHATVKYGRGINWRSVTGLDVSLKNAEMKIRPMDFKG